MTHPESRRSAPEASDALSHGFGRVALRAGRPQDRRVPGAGGTQRRLALVIGNDLDRVKPLANAVNDATAVAAALSGDTRVEFPDHPLLR